jgi:hypothetical protein
VLRVEARKHTLQLAICFLGGGERVGQTDPATFDQSEILVGVFDSFPSQMNHLVANLMNLG